MHSQRVAISKSYLAKENKLYRLHHSNANEIDETGIFRGQSVRGWEWTPTTNVIIQNIAENNDGNIIVVSTSDGATAIINGNDPGFHVQHNFYESYPSNSLANGKTFFISLSQRYRASDTLIIYHPSTLYDENDTTLTFDASILPTVLISGINNFGSISRSTIQKFSVKEFPNYVHMLKFASNQITSDSEVADGKRYLPCSFSALNGVFLSEDTIRFLAFTETGDLFCSDYNLKERQIREMGSSLSSLSLNSLNYKFLTDSIEVDEYCKTHDLFLLSRVSDTVNRICWISVNKIELESEFEIPNKQKYFSKVVCFKAVQSCSSSSAAVAVALDDNIFVIQVIVETSEKKGENHKIVLSNPHILYTLPAFDGIPLNVGDISISASNDVYSFKFSIFNDPELYYEFLCSANGPPVGNFRMLLAKGLFDEADELLSNASCLLDSTESLHNSEVALWRLKRVISQGNSSKNVYISIAQECLHRLCIGAVTGGSLGIKTLIAATNLIADWPKIQSKNHDRIPKMKEYIFSLKAMIRTLRKVLDHSPSNEIVLKENIKALTDRVNTMECLKSLLGSESLRKSEASFLDVSSKYQLYQKFFSLGDFITAEKLRRLEWGNSITADDIAAAVPLIPISIDPSTYSNWLEDFVIQKIKLKSPHLNSIRRWACQRADELDKRNSNLDSAIILLRSVVNGTAKLSISSLLCCSTNLCDENDAGNTEVVHNSCEKKLRNAYQLKKARVHGLHNDIVNLCTYDDAMKTALEMLKYTLTSEADDKVRCKMIQTSILEFCEYSAIDLDDVLCRYAQNHYENIYNDDYLSNLVSLSYSAQKLETKCKLAIKVIRAAISGNCSKAQVLELAKNSLAWTADDEVRSELEEACRLLSIYKLVRKYVKNTELFKANVPKHATSLLKYICRYVDEPLVLLDSFSLCEGFYHLSKRDACACILQNIIIAPESNLSDASSIYLGKNYEDMRRYEYHSRRQQCHLIVRYLYNNEREMTSSIVSKVIEFCSLMLNESEEKSMFRTKTIAACAIAILDEVKHDPCSSTGYFSNQGTTYWSMTILEFKRILDLQMEFNVFLSISDLRNMKTQQEVLESYFSSMTHNILTTYKQQSATSNIISKMKRFSLLVFGNFVENGSITWFEAISKALLALELKIDYEQCFAMLGYSGMLDEPNSKVASRALMLFARANVFQSIKVMRELPIKAPSILTIPVMKGIAVSHRLCQGHCLINSSLKDMEHIISIGSLSSLLIDILVKAGEGVGEELQSSLTRINQINMKNIDPVFVLHCKEKSLGINSDISKLAKKLHQSWSLGYGYIPIPPFKTFCLSVEYLLSLSGIGDMIEITSSSIRKNKTNSEENIIKFLKHCGAYSTAFRLLQFGKAHNAKISTDDCKNDNDLNMNLSEHLIKRSLGESNGFLGGKIDYEMSLAFLLYLTNASSLLMYKEALTVAMMRKDYERVFLLSNVGLRIGDILAFSKLFDENIKSFLINSYWWKVFQFHHVTDFDIDFFKNNPKELILETDVLSNYSANVLEPYAASTLIDLLLKATSVTLKDTYAILSILQAFSESYSVGIIFLKNFIEFFSFSLLDESKGTEIFRIETRKKAVELGLALLQGSSERVKAMKKALRKLEQSKSSGQDYESYFQTLRIYQKTLNAHVVEDPEKKQNILKMQGFIDRQLDTLALLSSYFSDKRVRPHYQEILLKSFKNPFHSLASKEKFDSDSPFSSILVNEEVASALSLLSDALELPHGYTHARALFHRFTKINTTREVLTFNSHVLPVLKRICHTQDCAIFAEWCAKQYARISDDRLKCLKYALNQAILYSSKVERETDIVTEVSSSKLMNALEMVKRIKDSLDSLEIFLKIEETLKLKLEGTRELEFKILIEKILAYLKKLSLQSHYLSEDFAQNLLSESIQMTSIFALQGSCVRLDDLCTIASAIREIFLCIEENHSQVNWERCSQKLIRKWLTEGDNDTDESNQLNKDIHTNRQLSSVEEESIFLAKGSRREIMEYQVAKTSLQIALLVTNENAAEHGRNVQIDKENEESTLASNILTKNIIADSAKKPKIKLKASNQIQDLLEIAFCKTSSSVNKIRLLGKCAITFAMRHRALRAVKFLISMNESSSLNRLDERFSLNPSYIFVSFVAMEVESIGLLLPHFDLKYTSNLDYRSYSYALWEQRHNCKFKARLFRLLIELCLITGMKEDVSLIALIMKELASLSDCNRTKLIICETLASITNRTELFNYLVNYRNMKELLDEVLKQCSLAIQMEIERESFKDENECVAVLRRLLNIYVDLADIIIEQLFIKATMKKILATLRETKSQLILREIFTIMTELSAFLDIDVEDD